MIFWKKVKKTWKNQFLAGKFSKNQKSSFLSPYSNKLFRPRQSFFVISKNVEKRPQHWLFWNLTKNFKKTAKKTSKISKKLQKKFCQKIHHSTPSTVLVSKKNITFSHFLNQNWVIGAFLKKIVISTKKNAPFSPKSATHNIISEKRLPKLYLRILSSTYMQSLKKFYTAVFENLNNFFIFLIRYFF